MKSFELPLPEPTSAQLKAEVHDSIAAWAREMAGTVFDLDAHLELAGIEHLLTTGRSPGRRRGC